MEENLMLTICQELASLEFQRVTGKTYGDLFHDNTNGCIFDFVAVKTNRFYKLLKCDICPSCRGKLAETNMNPDVLDSVDRILRRIRQPSFMKAFLACLTVPYLAFLFGIVVGVLVNVVSSVVMDEQPLSAGQVIILLALGIAVLLFPSSVFAWQWGSYLRRRSGSIR
jgi:hypothetical protein